MTYSSTHEWANGAIVTATIDRSNDEPELSIRIQDENERMITDIVVGEKEALSIAHAILSVITNPTITNT